MYIDNPITLGELYVENTSKHNRYTLLINANFQDYMDSLRQVSQFQVRSSQLAQKISKVGGALGVAAGSLGGPVGTVLGFTLGNNIGKFIGSMVGNKIYGQAISDMNEISQMSKHRHAQLAANLAFVDQIDGAIDTMRQNDNKRVKDALNAMSV